MERSNHRMERTPQTQRDVNIFRPDMDSSLYYCNIQSTERMREKEGRNVRIRNNESGIGWNCLNNKKNIDKIC